MKNIILLIFLTLILGVNMQAQILHPAIWKVKLSTGNIKIGDEIEVLFEVDIENGWYLYSSDFEPDLGPKVTTIEFESNDSYQLTSRLVPVNPKKKYDKIWKGDITYFKEYALFKQKIKVLKKPLHIEGFYEYQVCTDEKCIPFDDNFEITSN